jgi:hypothetical protein
MVSISISMVSISMVSPITFGLGLGLGLGLNVRVLIWGRGGVWGGSRGMIGYLVINRNPKCFYHYII